MGDPVFRGTASRKQERLYETASAAFDEAFARRLAPEHEILSASAKAISDLVIQSDVIDARYTPAAMPFPRTSSKALASSIKALVGRKQKRGVRIGCPSLRSSSSIRLGAREREALLPQPKMFSVRRGSSLPAASCRVGGAKNFLRSQSSTSTFLVE